MASRPTFPIRRFALLALFLLLRVLPASAQTLAHRNWEGSGLTAQSWWTRATFCEVDPHRDPGKSLQSITAHLDDFKSGNCDALVLDILSPIAHSSSPASLASGTLDDADELIAQMGRRKIRLVLVLDLAPNVAAKAPSSTSSEQMRFWLARGASGFLLRCDPGSSPAELAAELHQAHQIAASAIGTRVLIADAALTASSDPSSHRASDLQLGIKRLPLSGSVADLRTKLREKSVTLPLLAPQAVEAPAEFARLRLESTILLGNGAAALLPWTEPSLPGQEQRDLSPEQLQLWVPSGVDPLAPSPEQELSSWYQALGELRRTNPALRTGEAIYLDRDRSEVLAWVVKPKLAGASSLVVCNLSGHAVHVALTADLRALGVRGSYLRTLLTTETTNSAATLDAIDLSADGVFVGEVR